MSGASETGPPVADRSAEGDTSVDRYELADAIASAGWSVLMPAHRVDDDDQPVGRATCVAASALADGLVLAVVEDDRGHTYPVPMVVDGEEVRRARPGDGAAGSLVSALSADPVLGVFDVTTWHQEPVSGERGISVDQTNESVVVGDRAVVKWTFLAGEGPHPAPSMLAELERNDFTGMPRPWGVVQWQPVEDAAPRLLALVTDYVPGAVDGWTWAVEDLRDAAASDDESIARTAGRAVGELVASFHRALAGTERTSTVPESDAWRAECLADLDRALAVTSGAAHQLLAAHADEVRATFEGVPSDPTPVLRIHGDLHLGQVLRCSDSGSPAYVLIDFDGNPVVPPAERVREQPAALDVAGMAQSFVHAGLVVRRHHPSLDGDTVDRLADIARHAFLGSYRERLGEQVGLLDEGLLRPLALRQVCREFTYAATHLPRWSYVPEAALPMLLRAVEPNEEES